jgi:hypothetical protein
LILSFDRQQVGETHRECPIPDQDFIRTRCRDGQFRDDQITIVAVALAHVRAIDSAEVSHAFPRPADGAIAYTRIQKSFDV